MTSTKNPSTTESLDEDWIPLDSRLCLVPQEEERIEQGVQRLKERLSQIPWYRQKAEKHGENYWRKLYASGIME